MVWKPLLASAIGLTLLALIVPDARMAAALFVAPLLLAAWFAGMLEA